MNENPGGTPNPVNPAPGAGNINPIASRPVAPAVPVTPVRPMASTVPVTPTEPISEAQPITPAEPVEPTETPATESTIEEPKKKKKTGLIVGMIILVLALIAGGVALAMFFLNKADPVTEAMNKIMSGNAPANVAIDGTINIKPKDEYSPISSLKIDLKSSANPSSLVNQSQAVLTADIQNLGEFTVEFDEVYTSDGDLYFKIDGAEEALEESGLLYLMNLSNQLNQTTDIVDCGVDGEDCQAGELQEVSVEESSDLGTSLLSESTLISENTGSALAGSSLPYLSSVLDVIEIVDGEWIKISADDLKVNPYATIAGSDVSCITNLVSGADTNSSSAAELYKKNPFITSTNKDINISSKKYPVYKVDIDSKNLANFINSIQNSNISGDIYSCLNLDNTLVADADDIENQLSAMPEVYVEVNNNNNFTRLYLNSVSESNVNMTIDLNFSYPENIDVSEPDEYVDFSDKLIEILSGFYSLPVDIYEEV